MYQIQIFLRCNKWFRNYWDLYYQTGVCLTCKLIWVIREFFYFPNGYGEHDGRKTKVSSQGEQQLLDWFPRGRYVGYKLYDSSIDKRNQNISQCRRRRASCADNNEQDACVIIHVQELTTAIQPDTLLDSILTCFNHHNDLFQGRFSFIFVMAKIFKRSSNSFAFVSIFGTQRADILRKFQSEMISRTVLFAISVTSAISWNLTLRFLSSKLRQWHW